MGKLAQADFGGGIWRELDAPAGYVYDAVNGVVEGSDLLLRGPVADRGTEAATLWYGLAAGETAGGSRVVVWNPARIAVLAADAASIPTLVTFPTDVASMSRAVTFGGALVLRTAASPSLWVYGGSRKATYVSTPTGTVGSRDVTGSGFSANVDAGMVLHGGAFPAIVDRVDSDTALTLRDPLRVAIVGSFEPIILVVPGQAAPGTYSPGSEITSAPFSAMTVAGNKLLLATDSRVWVSRPREWVYNTDEFHDLGSAVRGLEALGSGAALAFSDAGVWAIENVALDLTDDAGNPQQQLRLVAPNVVLWHDSGIASWDGRAVVPCLDDVYLWSSPDGPPQVISRGVRTLYRSYVAAGWRPGVATVFSGHYFLPIVHPQSGHVYDTLVCRLDQTDGRGGLRPAWVRWTGALPGAYVREQDDAAATVRLTGARVGSSDNLLDLSASLVPSGPVTDSNGAVPVLDVTSNDLPTGPGNRNTVTRLRLRYALSGDGTVKASLIVGAASGYVETDLSPDGPVSDGEDSVSWRFVKRAARVRFRVRSSGGAVTLRLRSLEAFVRDSNRP